MTNLSAQEIATAVKSAAVSFPAGSPVSAGQTTGGIAASDQPTAVATALAAQAQGRVEKDGFWGSWVFAGQPSPNPTDIAYQAILLAAWLSPASGGSKNWAKVPTYADASYLLYMPTATAALATATAGPPTQLTPAAQTSGLPGLIEGANNALHDLSDPLWWRQVWFVGIGWMLIGIAVFQLINRGFVAPARNTIGGLDELAWDLTNLHANVGGALKRRRANIAAAKAAKAPKPAPVAPAPRRPRVTVTPGKRPPPAKRSSP
jgi:hypothetical protein